MTTEPAAPCTTCNGKGVVWAALKTFRLGEGFRAFMAAGCAVRYGEDRSVWHEIVCPRCDGKEGGAS